MDYFPQTYQDSRWQGMKSFFYNELNLVMCRRLTNKWILSVPVFLFFCFSSGFGKPEEHVGIGRDADLKSLLTTHCVKCHGKEGKVKGKVDLLKYSVGGDLRKNSELLQTVLEVIDFGEMPPEEEKPIPQKDKNRVIGLLKLMLNESVSEHTSPSVTQIRPIGSISILVGLKSIGLFAQRETSKFGSVENLEISTTLESS